MNKHHQSLERNRALRREGIFAFFPWDQYRKPLDNQIRALTILEKEVGSAAILELPTGSGKTAIGYTYLKWITHKTKRNVHYLVPNKTIALQVKQLHPDITLALGRNEFDCLYYEDKPRADEIPCTLLHDCPHRVDQDTGKTHARGATRCPYLQQKYEAKKAKVVVCTYAFYLYSGPLFNKASAIPGAIVIDEAHGIAKSVRQSLSYQITDHHLRRGIELLGAIEAEDEADSLKHFLDTMVRICKKRKPRAAVLLSDDEINLLISKLNLMKVSQMGKKIFRASKKLGTTDKEVRKVIRGLEVLTRDLRRYLSSLEYSKSTAKRHALHYTYAYYEQAKEEETEADYRLVFQAYHVAPIIRKMLSGSNVLAMSATIGNAETFGYESGIDKTVVVDLESNFPTENTRIYMPLDTANLAVKERNKREPNKSLRQIIHACMLFNQKGIRCLVLVVSNLEKKKFLELSLDSGLKEDDIISYGNGVHPKTAVTRFRNGEGKVLLGTAANFGEGIDLPNGLAPVIFVLRPAYAAPDDPQTQFEDKRFGASAWKLRNWRVTQAALQARGRNIRNENDKGVTFFVSQQFRRIVYPSLPGYLRPSYKGDLTLEQSLTEALALLK